MLRPPRHPLVMAGMCGSRAKKAFTPGNKYTQRYPHVLTQNVMVRARMDSH